MGHPANPGPTHFTGKERDSETGLDYFGARYYGSTTRFASDLRFGTPTLPKIGEGVESGKRKGP